MGAPPTVKRQATYDDLSQLPDHVIGEIVDGDLYASPRPAPRHVRASSIIGVEIGGPFDRGRGGPGGWWILDEPELHLGPEILVPDVAGWKRERMPALPEEACFRIAPDWICEVISPSTETLDRAHKLPAYGREGVTHAWLINPVARTLEVYRREGTRWLLLATHEGGGAVRAEPFEAIELDLAALWVE